jgi:hypothetical protein
VELSDVPDFLAAFRERSLSGAARRLGVNQSTMSRRVAELEGRVGPLFERLPEGLRPTPLAIRLLPHAERVESDAAELRRALHAPLAASGTVRVAVEEAVAANATRQGGLRGASVAYTVDDGYQDFADTGPIQACKQPQKRASAAARRAHDADQLAAGHDGSIPNP